MTRLSICLLGLANALGYLVGCNYTTPTLSLEVTDPGPTQITGLRTWYIIGNEIVESHDTLRVWISCAREPEQTTVFLDTVPRGEARRIGDRYIFECSVDELSTGEHTLALGTSDFESHFLCTTFYRSYPLYITLTNDWEQADQPDTSFHVQEKLHERYPGLVNTFFVGPYTFTDSTLSSERKSRIRDWLLRMETTYGNEIGLHLHPRCNFVELSGVECITDSSYFPNYPDGIDPEGYSIGCNRYPEQEYLRIITCADSIFVANGLRKPTSIRAGGWTHDKENLRALQAANYLVDGSGANTERLRDKLSPRLEHLLTEYWGSITDLSQPYYPLLSEPALTGDTFLLEVPNNAALADYVTGEEMIEIFEANRLKGGVLHSPRQVSLGYHSDNVFRDSHISRLHTALDHIQLFVAAEDRGPVVYVRMSDMAVAW